MIILDISKIVPGVNLKISRTSRNDQGKTFLYFSDGKTEWCILALTPSLQADLTELFETDNPEGWVGQDIYLQPILNQIRASLPPRGYTLEPAPDVEVQRRNYKAENVMQKRYKKLRWF